MSEAKVRVWVGVISHRYGENLYADTSKGDLLTQMADYAREWWQERSRKEIESHDGLPDEDVLDAYFDDHPDEWCTSDILTLPAQELLELAQKALSATNASQEV